ncbi:IL8 protein, partial [Acrocephalus arundinaceus]|nr:IL8 protein [Acrocephalus arundinaceus]
VSGEQIKRLFIYLNITEFCSTGKAVEKTDERGSQCQCISTHSKFIPPKTIQGVRLSQRGPHCKNVEIIAMLKDGREVCLEPTVPWIQLTVKALLAR